MSEVLTSLFYGLLITVITLITLPLIFSLWMDAIDRLDTWKKERRVREEKFKRDLLHVQGRDDEL